MYAKGKYTLGNCDRCGLQYLLNDLKFEVENGFVTKRRTCPECYDPDHPQNFIGRLRINDPQSVKDARPDPYPEGFRSFFGWNPVGSPLDFATVSVGTVTVTVT